MNERKKPREYIKIELENLDSANKQNEQKINYSSSQKKTRNAQNE